jgi:hypothetical protein
MTEYVTFTKDLDQQPIAMTREEFRIAGGLPEGWDDYIWQHAESPEAACEAHDLRLDEYMASEAGMSLTVYRTLH